MKAIQQNMSFQHRVGDAIAGRYPKKSPSQFIEERIYDNFPTAGDMRVAEIFHHAPWEARRAYWTKWLTTDFESSDSGFLELKRTIDSVSSLVANAPPSGACHRADVPHD